MLQDVSTAIEGGIEPIFIYGDFNFRLDFSAVVKVGTYSRVSVHHRYRITMHIVNENLLDSCLFNQ